MMTMRLPKPYRTLFATTLFLSLLTVCVCTALGPIDPNRRHHLHKERDHGRQFVGPSSSTMAKLLTIGQPPGRVAQGTGHQYVDGDCSNRQAETHDAPAH
jgi:hypothetical protein